MEETGVMLGKLGSLKVLVDKDDLSALRGAVVQRKMLTGIEYVFADGKPLLPLIIWLAVTHRST
jgi:hypothetical protein